MASKRNAKKNASRAKAKASETKSTSKNSEPSKGVNDKRDSSFPIVGIGGSADGFEAATELLKALPTKNNIAFVIVQHLDPAHVSRLPSLLGRATQMPVVEIKKRIKPEPDTVYVMPPNKGLLYKNGALTLIDWSGRPTAAIDNFFESLAAEQGPRAIGVLLSGSGGSDGTAGLRAIKAAGGITFAQDEQSAKFPAMPRNAILSGFVDAALSPKEIAQELRRIAEHPYVKRPEESDEAEPTKASDLDDLGRIFLALRKHTGVDFSSYKQSTLQRRIHRRMVLHRIERLRQYANFLRGNTKEIHELFNDLLINVTQFFRDKDAFNALKKNHPRTDQTKTGERRFARVGAGLRYGRRSLFVGHLHFGSAGPRHRQDTGADFRHRLERKRDRPRPAGKLFQRHRKRCFARAVATFL